MGQLSNGGYDPVANLHGYTPLFRAALDSVAGRNLRVAEHAILNVIALKWFGNNNGKIGVGNAF